ncbi:MAG: alpha,alpha-trehalase TreF [Aestuariibacter sp.]
MSHKEVIRNTMSHCDTFLSSQLFHDVQMQGLYSDSKVFADATARTELKTILSQYDASNIQSPQALQTFVEKHFQLPVIPDCKQHQVASVQQYIETLWLTLRRQPDEHNLNSLLPLPYPYIVPGGRFQEIYYWDSYFTAVGLMQANQCEMVINMIDNFIVLLDALGKIPNGNRGYYYSRSQPPILALLVDLVASTLPYEERLTFVKSRLNAIATEYQFWMSGSQNLSSVNHSERRCVRMPDGSILNRYWDDIATPRPESYREDKEATEKMTATEAESFYRNIRAACESGWDFSSRWLANPKDLHSIQTTHIVPVDLNCLLYKTEQLLADFSDLCADKSAAKAYQDSAIARRNAINHFLWDADNGFYFDYNHVTQATTAIWSLAASATLFCSCADQQQAKSVAEHLKNQFLQPGGLLTTLTHTEQQWDSPNGWAPLHWFAVKGCLDYGHSPLAKEIMQNWLSTVERYFEQHHCLMEKYNVEAPVAAATGGEYQVQEGFGWSNGISAAFYHMLAQ